MISFSLFPPSPIPLLTNISSQSHPNELSGIPTSMLIWEKYHLLYLLLLLSMPTSKKIIISLSLPTPSLPYCQMERSVHGKHKVSNAVRLAITSWFSLAIKTVSNVSIGTNRVVNYAHMKRWRQDLIFPVFTYTKISFSWDRFYVPSLYTRFQVIHIIQLPRSPFPPSLTNCSASLTKLTTPISQLTCYM